MNADFKTERDNMVERQLVPRGISFSAVLDAMRTVPRHLFVPMHMQGSSYEDCPLPIGLGQTISQPYIVAYMTEQLEPFVGMKVLEIGTGSGYQAAILAFLGCDVYSVECIKEHAENARLNLKNCGFDNVIVKHGNGYEGFAGEAPFDAIIVTAAPDSIPTVLVEQLKDEGKMIIPVGDVYSVQSLKLLVKSENSYTAKELMLVRFVPMV